MSAPNLDAIVERAEGVLEMLATCTPVADWPPDMDHESDSDSYLWGCCREALEDASNHVLALAEEVRRLEAVTEAARVLHHFLEEEKVTTSPPDELLSKECVACESSDDYEREEQLSGALGQALAALSREPAEEAR